MPRSHSDWTPAARLAHTQAKKAKRVKKSSSAANGEQAKKKAARSSA
jgi:hypothetical protein